ncbi:hypothetical protein [Paeniglutamicibacter antarcticus]|uniref:Uncharacterized protein n=1 Tax=Paeniglutamicibacter antarcticus TaxID=494023 RepID=A0ABP9TR44_9MICC
MAIAASTRNIIAVGLLLVAVLASGAAMLGSTAARLLDTPEPLQRILGPLATDPELRQVLPDELAAALGERITQDTAVPQILKVPLQHAVAAASGAMLDEPGFQAAWEATIESARTDFTTRMAEAAKGTAQSGQVTLRLDLAPLLDSGYDTLHSSLAGSPLGTLLPGTIAIPSVMVDTRWPAADDLSTHSLNAWLSVARGWGWLAAGALVLAAAGLLVATRSGRGWAGFAAGVGSLLLGVAARIFFGSLDSGALHAADPNVQALVTDRLLDGLQREMGANTTVLVTGGILAILAGAGWSWWVARQRRDRAVG